MGFFNNVWTKIKENKKLFIGSAVAVGVAVATFPVSLIAGAVVGAGAGAYKAFQKTKGMSGGKRFLYTFGGLVGAAALGAGVVALAAGFAAAGAVAAAGVATVMGSAIIVGGGVGATIGGYREYKKTHNVGEAMIYPLHLKKPVFYNLKIVVNSGSHIVFYKLPLFFKKIHYCISELFNRSKKLIISCAFIHNLPKPFNGIQIWAVGW